MTTSVPGSPLKSSTSSRSSEPSMFVQQPSSSRSQDVSHLLNKIFRQLYTHDSVPSDTVEYLNTSRGSSDTYHEEYVKALQKVQIERSRRMSEAAMLERHIMQAQARATSADERELTRISSLKEGFPDLGLPPSRSYYRSCIDSDLLRRHKLITPEDFVKEECLPVPAPSGSPLPMYTKSTRSSFIKTRASLEEEVMPHIEQQESFQHIASDFDTDATVEMLPPKVTEVSVSRGNKAKQLWMAEMQADEREQNRAQLAILEDRVNYLRNKRFLEPSDPKAASSLIRPKHLMPKEFGIKPMPDPVVFEEPDDVFLARPKVIQFTQYAVGIVYEMTLELKNISSVLRPVRVIPPKTEHFSVSLGAFPGEHGLVAPGMSCYYTIRFSPDSLGNFDDILKIETQAREPLYVPLEGRRPPPILSLSDTFRMEECLIGGYKVGQFTVKNTGGAGRFCVLPTSSWPAANFKTVISSSCVVVPPFEVRPSMFELRRDSTMLLEVLFAPTALENYSQSIAIVCDNCQVKYFNITGRGQTAEVKLVSVEGGQAEIQMGEMCDISAEHHVHFTTLNAYTYMQKVLVVKNCVDVELPYSWVVIKPHILTPDPLSTEAAPIPTERVQEEEAAFSVHPESGVLRPSVDEEFVITFAPPKVGSYHNVLHLVLRSIPRLPVKADEEAFSSCNNLLSPRITTASKSKLPSEPLVEDVTSLEIEVKGECEPLSVILQPYAVHVPGSILVETSIKKPFRMINQSVCSIIFQWENVSDNYILEVEPPVAELAGRSEMDFELTISCAEPRKIDHTLMCYVQHLETPLTLHVTAEIKGPEVVVECGSVDLGLVRLGETATFELTLRNMSRVQAKWSLDELVNLGTPTCLSTTGKVQLSKEGVISKGDKEKGYELVFTPQQSILRPVEVQTVTVLFVPNKCQSMRTLIELQVQDGAPSTVALQVEVQQPDVCLLSCEVTLNEVFIGVPTYHQVTLVNKTLLATEFEWGELQFCPSSDYMETSGGEATSIESTHMKVPITGEFSKKDYDYYSVSFTPRSGVIGPREQVVVQMQFLARQMFAIPDFRVGCQIKDMVSPLFLAVYGFVSGPDIAFNVIPVVDSIDDCIVDFGSEVALGSNPMRQILVKNHTAIPTRYKLSVRTFPGPRPPSPPESRPHDDSAKSRSNRILARTPNLVDPLSQTPEKAHNDLCKIVLRENRGVAFTIEPSEGKLGPYEEITITVTAFSDMWGMYTDAINCQTITNIGSSNRNHQLPIKMTVVGCPIYFQMTSPQSRGMAPKLRFGTHVCGAPPLRRHMKIINSGPVDIRLDWTMYKEDKASQKLMDVKFLFGNILPLLDADGNEILPPTDDYGKMLHHKEMEDFLIPNSPDSTPPSTREVTNMEQDPAPGEDFSRFKVIQLLLRPHDGIEETEHSGPYSIEPTQLVIPARRYGTITITFTPLKCDVLETGVDCNGYAHGHISLDAPNAQVPCVADRLEKYNVQPLRLDMTAHCKPALLTIECIDDDEMSYRAAASDLLDTDGQVMSEKLKLSSCTVSNNTLTPLTFGLSTTTPFYIMVEGATRGRRLDKPMLQLQQLTLYPRQNLMVHMAFRLSTDLLTYIDGATNENSEFFELERNECETKLHFRRKLVVSFSNNTEQTMPLAAIVYVPSLMLSKESLDFGTCLVGQQRFQQLILSNPSCSDSRWIAELESMSENCTETTFEVQPGSGHLDAYSTCVAENKALLTFSFQAKHAEEYTAVFILHGILGEEPRRLKVRGEGSYDGLFEAQTMPLAAIVYVPSLMLSKESLDFGTCLVGQQRFQQLILSNPSCSDSRWIAELESMSENCTETTFEVQPGSGHLDAYSTCVAENKALLTFSFQAKHAEEYTAVFILHGILGEEPRRLKVRGEGSYDGLFEAQVNI